MKPTLIATLLLLLLTALSLSACVDAGYTNFPPCNSQAPRHYEIKMPYGSDFEAAHMAGQNAILQGWTNVEVDNHQLRHNYVRGDCTK